MVVYSLRVPCIDEHVWITLSFLMEVVSISIHWTMLHALRAALRAERAALLQTQYMMLVTLSR